MLPNRKHLYPTSLRWALDLRPSYYCFTGPDRKRLQSVLHCLDDHHAGGESIAIAIVTTTSQSRRTAASAAGDRCTDPGASPPAPLFVSQQDRSDDDAGRATVVKPPAQIETLDLSHEYSSFDRDATAANTGHGCRTDLLDRVRRNYERT